MVLAFPVQDEAGDNKLCPAGAMPHDWLARCLQGHLLFSHAHAADMLMPEVGNGYLAVEMSSNAIYIKGLNNGEARGASGVSTHRARIPRSTHVVESLHKEPIRHCGYALDLEQAVFMKRSRDPVGARGVLVEERWYAPLHEPTLLVHEIQLENPTSEDHTVTIQHTRRTQSDDLVVRDVEAKSFSATHLDPESVFAIEGSNRVPEMPAMPGHLTRFALASNTLPSKVALRAGQARTLFSLAVVTTSLNFTDPTHEALTTLQGYMADGFARAGSLLSEHTAAWAARAEAGRIEVAGDLDLAQVVNSSLYYLRTSIRSDWPHGLSPGGLASNCYDGRVFWDQEIWMLPPLLMLEPPAAESLLRYRVNHRAEAMKKAQTCGSDQQRSWCPPGYADRVTASALMFPWESASSGAEVQYDGGKMGPWGRYEQHVSGGVALAARQYWYATHDRSWLAEVGFPLASGIAAFYAARVEPRPHGTFGAPYDLNQYDLNQVMGPDEYQWPVNNSAYSNAVAQVSLDFAYEAASVLHRSTPAYNDFKRTAQHLPIGVAAEVPGRPDLKGGYHPEYEGYPFKQQNPTVKQADTILLSYPVDVEMSEQVRRNDLEFYENVTDRHGPAMTWSMFAVGWLSIGEIARAATPFREGYANAQRPYRVWSQFAHGPSFPGCANFITGAGGFLQSIIYGLAGMRVRRDHLEFRAAPPSATGTKAAQIAVHSFHYHGSRLRIEMGEDTVQYELLPSASHDYTPLCLTIEGLPEARLQIGAIHFHKVGKRAAIAQCGRSPKLAFQPTVPPLAERKAKREPIKPQVLEQRAERLEQRAQRTAERKKLREARTVAREPDTTQDTAPRPKEPAHEAAVAVVLLTVRNIDHAQLTANPSLAGAFEKEIRSVLAAASGRWVQPSDIAVTLAAGSVAVTAAISAPEGSVADAVLSSLGGARESTLAAEANQTGEANRTGTAAAMARELRRRSLARKLLGGISSLHGIGSVSSGPVDVADVRVLDRMPAAPSTLSSVRAWMASMLGSARRWLQSAGRQVQSLLGRLWRQLGPVRTLLGRLWRQLGPVRKRLEPALNVVRHWAQRLLRLLPDRYAQALQALPWPLWAGLALAAVCLCCLGCCCCRRRPGVSRHWPFNGTWVRHHNGHAARNAGIIVIINDTVHWQQGKESRIVQLPDDSYQIMSPTEDDEAYSVDLMDGDLLVDGYVFTRYRRAEDQGDREPLIGPGG